MTTSFGGPRRTLAQGLAALLRTDRIFQATVGFFIFAVLWRVLPSVGEGQRELMTNRYAPAVFIALILAALRWRLAEVEDHERSFWNDLTLAYGCWSLTTLAFLLRLLAPGMVDGDGVRILSEILFPLYYVGLILAIERQPHRRNRWRSTDLERFLTWPSVIVFIASLVVYFVLIPLLNDFAEYESYVSTMGFYVALDLVVLVKLAYAAWTSEVLRWRSVYGVLAVGHGITFLTDLAETLETYRPDLGAWNDARWSFLWEIAYVAVVAAIRLRHVRLSMPGENRAADDRLEGGLPGPSGQTMVSGLIFPFIHFSAYSLHLLGAPSKPSRELLVGWTLMVLGAITFIQYRLLGSRARRLWQEHTRAIDSLRSSEKDLRLMIERKRSHALIGASEDRFFKVFHSSPIGIGILTLAEGRFIEINDSCERISGYLRDEILGRTPYELPFSALPSNESFLKVLNEKGSVRDLEVAYRTRAGEDRWARIAIETIEFQGEPCLMATFDDVTARRRREEELRGRALLDRVDDAVFAVDGEGRVHYWNPRAEALFGLAEKDAVGRVWSEILVAGTDAVRHRIADRPCAAVLHVRYGDADVTVHLIASPSRSPRGIETPADADPGGYLFFVDAALADIADDEKDTVIPVGQIQGQEDGGDV